MDHSQFKRISVHYSLLPVSEAVGKVVFGTINPENSSLKRGLEFLLSREVQFVTKTEAEILACIKELLNPVSIRNKSDRAGKHQDFIKKYSGCSISQIQPKGA